MCPLRFPVEVTFLAVLYVGQVHTTGSLLGLRDATWVRPGRPPVRYKAEETERVKNEEPESSPRCQRYPRYCLIGVERLQVPVQETEIVPAEVSIEKEKHGLHS